MRIAVDLDGVLADTISAFCRIINKRRQRQFTPESFMRWKAWEIADITKDEFLRTLDEAWREWKTIPPTENRLNQKVGRLRTHGQVDIVTGRSPHTLVHASSWLREHKIPHDLLVRTESTKAKVNLSYDVFIDDSAELMSLLSSKSDARGILYSQPWNRNAAEMPRISRVERWDQIPAVLRAMYPQTLITRECD